MKDDLPGLRSRQSGFTLIELMIAVAVVAVLAAIAVPAYTAYLIRGRIPQATAALAAKQVQLEQFFQDRRTYVGSDTIGVPPPCSTDTATSRYFTFSCAGAGAPSATTFVLTATGTGTMAGFAFTVDQSGTKTTSAVPSSGGWSAPSPNNCWVVRPGGQC